MRTTTLLGALVAFGLASPLAFAQSVFTVDRLTDTGDGEGLSGDLRYCISNTVDGDTIRFDVIGTINLTGALQDLTRSINIEGPGANLLTVRRDTGIPYYRIFTVASSARVRISGLTIANGLALRGGGINNSGDLIVSACTISGNGWQSGAGGGIFNIGSLAISDSTISGNALAGGIIGQCGNAYGAGVHNEGRLTISNTTISSNLADCYHCYKNCDYIGTGGGISNSGSMTIINSTVSNNRANVEGGGIINLGGSVYMRNTIVARNTGWPSADFDGRLSSSGYNLIGDSRGGVGYDATDLLNVDPMIGPLQGNGGPTLTHALLPGSPAIDAGDPDFIGPPDFDQRGEGFPRVVTKIVDVGAFEFQAKQ